MVQNQKDPYFERNYSVAKSNAIKVGVYLYSYAESTADAKQEAKVCLGWLNNKNLDLPIYIDMEDDSLIYLGKEKLTKIALKFCEEIEKCGYKAGVYANANWFNNYLDYNKISTKYSIWLAQYANNHSFTCDIWQYTDNGVINGNDGKFDLNYIYGIPKLSVTFKKNAGLYKYPFKDVVGGTGIKQKTVKKGTTATWISDDGYGWSEIEVDGNRYYAVNSRINKAGLSEYPKIIIDKEVIAYRVSGNTIEKSTKIKKGKTIKLICTIEKGKFKGYKLISYCGKEFYLK